jgi:hypothetical protein
VLAGLIIAALLKIADAIFSLNIFYSIIIFFIAEYKVPLWGLIIIGVIPLALVTGAIFFLSKLKKGKEKKEERTPEKKSAEPPWIYYVEDEIFSILWQWGYFHDNKINWKSLLALCPACKRQLKEFTARYGVYNNVFRMDCPHCSFKSSEFKGELHNIKKDVLAEIDGRIRSEEYKNKLNRP